MKINSLPKSSYSQEQCRVQASVKCPEGPGGAEIDEPENLLV